MVDETAQSGSIGLVQIVLALVVVAILAYAVLATNILLGFLAASIIVFNYYAIKWVIEFLRLFRRLVVALERIAENS
ncbi:hypothetical protein [Halosolutus gelatinilyticus]|uniref:hypothetical protein n=1 Tax=Halosolutus gelatinilyticus TaxID=2931975 RepID=UPI001FF2A532|nr:hypothetical protein [Halosolutus gelatinilyticus]